MHRPIGWSSRKCAKSSNAKEARQRIDRSEKGNVKTEKHCPPHASNEHKKVSKELQFNEIEEELRSKNDSKSTKNHKANESKESKVKHDSKRNEYDAESIALQSLEECMKEQDNSKDLHELKKHVFSCSCWRRPQVRAVVRQFSVRRTLVLRACDLRTFCLSCLRVLSA